MKRKVDATIRVRTYSVLADRLEVAVAAGYRRAHKHTDKPDEAAICEAIHRYVMDALCEVLDFGES